MRTYFGFILAGLIVALSLVAGFCGVGPISCLQSVGAGTGVTVTGNNPNPTVSLSATDSQTETFSSSITVNSNLGVTGAINAPLTVASSETVTGNFGVAGQVNQPLTVTSSSTFTTNVEVDGFLQLFSRTKAQIAGITPAVVGQLYYCSDCTALRTCISTGTAVGAFSSPVAVGTACN